VQLEGFLEASRGRFPDKIALICGDRRLSYRDVERDANRLAHGLIALGVERGDRVAVYLDNSVEAVLSIFAILKAGAVFLLVNPTTKADKLAYILNNCRARVLVAHAAKRRVIDAIRDKTPHLQSVVLAGGGRSSHRAAWSWDDVLKTETADGPPSKRSIDIDLAALIYTSGSTGQPKGVMMTHLNMVTAARSITRYLENSPDDVILNALPLSFDYGLYQVLMTFLVGATLVLERSFAYPQLVVDRLAAERVTGFPLVPTMAAMLLEMKDFTAENAPHLRYVSNTGAVLPPAHIERLRALFPTTAIYSMYGLTECKRVAYLPPDQLASRPTSVGKAIPNTEVWIVDGEGRRVGPGAVGELVVRGSHVMKGYWEQPEETDRVLRPGPLPGERVLHTGDLFTMDDEGYLYFQGRRDDMIKTRGQKVSPKEIENVLYAFDAVAEAAVFGVADPIAGQAIKAVVVLREGALVTDQDLRRHCANRLEDFMVPAIIEVRAQLPKTPNGKIDKRTVEAMTAS